MGQQALTRSSLSCSLLLCLAAALSITTLYRSSKKNAKRAYNAGYAAACQDLLEFIQQGVSASGDVGQSPAGPSRISEGTTSGMTIGQIMDWTEARVEAIKAREEEEDEDEERAQPARSAAAAAASRAVATAKAAAKKPMNETQPPKETVRVV